MLLERRMTGEDEIVNMSIGSGDPEDTARVPVEFLNTLNPPGILPHNLLLKKNCIIMLIRNLDLSGGHCNGVRYIVTDVKDHLIVARKLEDPNSICFIPRIEVIDTQSGFPWRFKTRQFPVRLAFAMTINKLQGKFLDRCSISLPKSVFSHGQLYVGTNKSESGLIKNHSKGSTFQV
ncbi:uncharacterized protein LOC106872760 [Octopus bimaculoides]|uniref:uncharacterized protein LOC106872760 n=1 Tax=Octopus bimaculoides TaxID=37653 RepID=UPI00071D6437|nr:uncharacterized protein LOC106872760 [Octopus bimaculoides]|eukprot:XP_014775338.1 PREDICTED: uncharacterized protein LOC106872760 [Octopus bimaculoides]